MKGKKSFSIDGKLLFSIIVPFMITIIVVLSTIKDFHAFIWENYGEVGAVYILCVIPIPIVALFIFGMVTGIKSVNKSEAGELGLLAIVLNIVMLVLACAMVGGVL